MAKVTLSTTPPTAPTIPAEPQRAFLGIENNSLIDVFYGFAPGVAASGADEGLTLKAGERLMLDAGQSLWIRYPLYFVAASGTPVLKFISRSN